MAFPAKNESTQDPGHVGWHGTPGMPEAASAEPEATSDTADDTDVDAHADADSTSQGDRAASVPAPRDAGSPVVAGHTTESGTTEDARTPVDTTAGQRWNQILAMFVDDPRGSVTQAASMTDEAIEAFVSAARERQARLASSWQDGDPGTEELRKALQDYRVFWSRVTEIPQSA